MKSTSSEDYTYTYRYDALNRVDDRTIEIVGTTNSVVAIDDSYDLAGNRNRSIVSVDGAEDHTNTYWYDRLNRLRSIHQHENASTAVTDKLLQFDYDLANQQEVTWRKVGTDLVSRTDFAYDWTGRLDTLDHEFGTSSALNYDWDYDRANRVTSFTILDDPHGESVSQYDYSQRNELKTASRTISSNLGDEAYEFDENGNRLIAGNPTVGEYNQLTTYGDNDYIYLHGLLVQKVTPAGSLTYTWDARNRLYEFKSHPDGTTVQYGYDASNQLVSRELSGSSSAETHFIYDNGQVILQLDGTTGDVTNRYVWGPSVDQLLAEETVDTATTTSDVSWPLADNQGTIRDWIDSDGALLQHIAYDSFGNQLDPLTGNPLPSSEIDHLFAYTGRMFDPASGLQNNLNRWFDPAVGRWISEDPIGFAAGDANLYRYVGNSPTNATDPSGLAELPHIPKESRRAIQRFVDFGESLPDGFLDNNLNREYLQKFQDNIIDRVLKNKAALATCTDPKMIGTYQRTIGRQTNRLLNLGKLKTLSKRVPGVRYGAVIIFFAADANANGTGNAAANATPIVGDIRGMREDLNQFYKDLARDVATAQELLNADVEHGHNRANEAFNKFVPYELNSRAGCSFNQQQLQGALDSFYNGLYNAYRGEVKTSSQRRAFGLAFPVTVDRSGVGTASINPLVQQFQQDLDNARIR